jgi:hypothetical protein
VVLVVAVVCAAYVQGVTGPPAPAAAASTVTSTCRDAVGTGCVEVRITPTGGRPTPTRTVRELQMNLCHSGVAHCYRGAGATAEAAGVIDGYLPSVVTLNEICAADILDATAAIPSAMTAIARRAGDATVYELFTPAVNRTTGRPYRCTDGDLYGIGIVGRGALVGPVGHHLYRAQYARTDEGRVAVCAPADGYDVCTTHLESDDRAVAADQCRELMNPDGYASRVRRSTDEPPMVVAGDFNLPDLRGCLPTPWLARGDGDVQHVNTTGLRFTAVWTVHMRYTDHPAFLVDLTG